MHLVHHKTCLDPHRLVREIGILVLIDALCTDRTWVGVLIVTWPRNTLPPNYIVLIVFQELKDKFHQRNLFNHFVWGGKMINHLCVFQGLIVIDSF